MLGFGLVFFWAKSEARLKLQLMNTAESIIVRVALRQEGIDRQQLIKTKETSITNCHILVVKNNMRNKYYSINLVQKRFKTVDIIKKKKSIFKASVKEVWKWLNI